MRNTASMPLISVIIPVYNLENTIKKCLNSVINQTYTNIEIIIINDGSTDQSDKICIEYKNRDNRIYYFFQENKGVSVARNVGLEHAKGKYIIFVDGDDFVDEKHVENLYIAIVEYKSDISVCGITFEKGKKIYKKYIQEKQYENLSFLKPLISYNDFGGYICNKLYSIDIINNVRFDEDLNIAEDLLFNLRVFLNSKKIVKIKNASYHYCINSFSATQTINNNTQNKLESYLFANERALDIIRKSTKNKIILNLFEQKVLLVKAEIFYFELKYFNKFNIEFYRDVKKMRVLNVLNRPNKLFFIVLFLKIYKSEKFIKYFIKMRS